MQKTLLILLLLCNILYIDFVNINSVTANNFSEGFDYPIGAPNHIGYYNALDFGKPNKKFNGKFHLGEDWNGNVGGDKDLGYPVSSIANGEIVYANSNEYVWGGVLIIKHNLPNGEIIYSFYGHLINMNKMSGFVDKREALGGMGKGQTNQYPAHLHFEIRTDSNPDKLKPGLGYSVVKKPAGWVDPSEFIDSHRQLISPPKAVTLSITSKTDNSTSLSWTKNESPYFYSYKLFRLLSVDDLAPVLVTELAGEATTEFNDHNLKQNTEYFYRVDVCNIADQCTSSEIISTKTDIDPNYIGRIVYSSKIGNNFQIYLMDGAKDNIKRLRMSNSNDYNSKWSPDGKKILFDSIDIKTGNRQVFTMDKDGSNQQQITSLKYSAEQADWFPDGSKIVFKGSSAEGQGIYTQNIDGADLKMITPQDIPNSPTSLNSYNPTVSPDGQSILFEAIHKYGTQSGKGGLFIIGVDGANLTQLTNNFDSNPDMAPSGEIVFLSNRDGGSNLFWSVYYLQDNLDALYKVAGGAPSTTQDPSWSNDSSKIIYSAKSDARTQEDFELVVATRGAEERTVLTDNNVDDIDADIWIDP